MSRAVSQLIVVAVFVLFFGYLSYRVVQPFLSAVIWAVVLAIVSYPLYKYFLRVVRSESIASLLNLIVILVLILGPISYFMYLLVNELVALAQYLQQNVGTHGMSGNQAMQRFAERALSALGVNQRDAAAAVVRYATAMGQRIAAEVPRHATVVATTMIDLFLMSVVLFLLPSHGPRLMETGLNQIPLPKRNRDRFKDLAKDVVLSTIYGGLFSAVSHGILAVVVFAIARVPSPVLLALLAAFSSMLPIVGAAIVWFGIAVYLFAVGRTAAAIALAVIGVLGVQAIDHFLRPWLSKGKSRVPFVVVLFGILGGLEYFGFSGFVLGPLVLAVFIALLRLFRTIRAEATPTIEDE